MENHPEYSLLSSYLYLEHPIVIIAYNYSYISIYLQLLVILFPFHTNYPLFIGTRERRKR